METKNYPSRRKSTFQAARTAKHTTYVCNVRCVRTCSVRIRTESGRCFIYERNRNIIVHPDYKRKSACIPRLQFCISCTGGEICELQKMGVTAMHSADLWQSDS